MGNGEWSAPLPLSTTYLMRAHYYFFHVYIWRPHHVSILIILTRGFELKTTQSSVKCGNSIYVDYYYFLYVCTSCDLHYSSNCECVSSPVCKNFRISYENLFIAFRELSISLLICMRLKLEMQQI